MRTLIAVIVVGFGCTGCSDRYPAPNTALPTAPESNDPAFTSQGLHNWYLIGDGVTPDDGQLTAIVTAPMGTNFVDVYIGTLPVIRATEQSNGFGVQASIADLAAGDYDILFTADGSDTAFAKVTFHRSAAYYVLVSTDYDFSDPGIVSTGYMDSLHQDHPGVRITHFWAPYTYTDPAVNTVRQGELDTWIQKQRDTFHDEIGLHIHPYCNFVVDAGLDCITDQSTVYPTGDTSGYTIEVAAYGRDNFAVLLNHAFELFAQHGLGKPQTFRAGGWTADMNTFLALTDTGFITDSSALNWKWIQAAWAGKVLASWTMEHWAPIDDTSQPYWPSTTDVLTSTPGADLPMLEVPIDSAMVDYVTLQNLTDIFDENWDGVTPLAAPRTLMMGFHPAAQLSMAEYKEVDDFLTYCDPHLASSDLGPVVYTTLSDVTPAFPSP